MMKQLTLLLAINIIIASCSDNDFAASNEIINMPLADSSAFIKEAILTVKTKTLNKNVKSKLKPARSLKIVDSTHANYISDSLQEKFAQKN